MGLTFEAGSWHFCCFWLCWDKIKLWQVTHKMSWPARAEQILWNVHMEWCYFWALLDTVASFSVLLEWGQGHDNLEGHGGERTGNREVGRTEELSQGWQRGEHWWGPGHGTRSLQADGTVGAKSRTYWKRIVEISQEEALISIVDQPPPDKSTSNVSLERRKLLLAGRRIPVEEKYLKLISIASWDMIFVLLRFYCSRGVKHLSSCLQVFPFS